MQLLYGMGMICTGGLCSLIAVVQQAFGSLMASVAWASFLQKATSVSETCFLQRASIDALVISSCPMALFISPCSQSTSSERAPVSAPEGVLDGRVVGVLATSGVSNARVREGEWLISMVSSGIAIHSDGWGEVVTGWEESANAWLKVSSIAHDKSSWTSAVMLMWVSVFRGTFHGQGRRGKMVSRFFRELRLWVYGPPVLPGERSTSRNEG